MPIFFLTGWDENNCLLLAWNNAIPNLIGCGNANSLHDWLINTSHPFISSDMTKFFTCWASANEFFGWLRLSGTTEFDWLQQLYTQFYWLEDVQLFYKMFKCHITLKFSRALGARIQKGPWELEFNRAPEEKKFRKNSVVQKF